MSLPGFYYSFREDGRGGIWNMHAYQYRPGECTIVIELQPNNILAWKRLGSAYFAIGKKDKARETWERALKIAPDDVELKQFIKQAK